MHQEQIMFYNSVVFIMIHRMRDGAVSDLPVMWWLLIDVIKTYDHSYERNAHGNPVTGSTQIPDVFSTMQAHYMDTGFYSILVRNTYERRLALESCMRQSFR